MSRKLTVPTIRAEISVGELVDKITILRIKAERITAFEPLRHVCEELAALEAVFAEDIPPCEAMGRLMAELQAVNEALWDTEDAIRAHERDGDFGSGFVELARSVYRTNDRRAAIKRRINELSGSRLLEEKAYTAY